MSNTTDEIVERYMTLWRAERDYRNKTGGELNSTPFTVPMLDSINYTLRSIHYTLRGILCILAAFLGMMVAQLF